MKAIRFVNGKLRHPQLNLLHYAAHAGQTAEASGQERVEELESFDGGMEKFDKSNKRDGKKDVWMAREC